MKGGEGEVREVEGRGGGVDGGGEERGGVDGGGEERGGVDGGGEERGVPGW